MRTRLATPLSLCLLLMALLPATALAGGGTDRGALSLSGTRVQPPVSRLGTNPSTMPGSVGLASKITPAPLSLMTAQPEIPVGVDGYWYWSGNLLRVDGFVYNESPYALNNVQVNYEVWLDDTKIASSFNPMNAHVLDPGGAATFGIGFDLPAYAGNDNLEVVVYSGGYQETLPYPVELTEVSSDVVVSGGLRTYTCVYRNDSSVTVHTPIFEGFEEDAEGYLIDTLWDSEGVQIAPGATWTAVATGYFPNETPAGAAMWATALPMVTHNTIYRFRNLQNGFYLLTADKIERNTIVRELQATWLLEGAAYHARLATNTAPLWRFRNIHGGFYLYTADASEKATILATLGDTWQYEGPTFKVSLNRAGAPVWRFRNLQDGTYLYSADAKEKSTIVATLGQTWLLEGPSYYVAP